MDEQPIIGREARDLSSRSPSLRTKLLLFTAALVLVPGILLVLLAERSGRDSLERVIGRQLAREAGHTADRLSAVLRRERETLASFARQDLMREIRVADIDKRVSMSLTTLRDGNPGRLDYWVVDPQARVVASSDPSRIGEQAQGPEARGEAGIFGPIAPTDAGQPGLLMTTPIRDPDDPRRRLGTLVGLFDWSRLTEVTEQVRRDLASQGIAAEVLVSRADGAFIAGLRPSVRPPAPASDVSRAAGAGPPGYFVDEPAGLILGRAALAPDLPDWTLLVVEPRAHALAPARRLSHRLVLTMGLALLVALALATLAARRVVRPLSELTRAIRGLSRGEAKRRPVPVRSDDELGTLAASFNEMASELDRTQRDLIEAEKFAFVGELAAGVAHEIRTALGVLGSSAQMLERALPQDRGAQASELAEMIREEVGRLGGVVDDLLTLDRARPLQLETGRLSEPLFRAVDFVGPQAQEKGIRLARHAPDPEPGVPCDPELIQQVAVNLLVNAIQAVAPGGRIEARVLDAEDGYAGFEVSDDGPGIPSGLRERIFQPFFTAREGGVGLGLTFVKRVVHDHRGFISLKCEPGCGTRVRIRLPRAEPRA